MNLATQCPKVVMTLREQFEALKKLPEDQMREQVRSMNPRDLLKLAVTGAEMLYEMVEAIPGQIYDAMEDDLPTHHASADVTIKLLQRLRVA